MTPVLDLQSGRLTSAEVEELLERQAEPHEITRLYLANNELTQLPSSLSRFSNLEILYAGGNRLKSLSVELFSLTRLSTLYLSSNYLEKLPQEIGRLTSLTALSLHTNRLRSLPLSITQLTNLEVLYLKNNPLPPVLAENVFGSRGQAAALQSRIAVFFARMEPCRRAVLTVLCCRSPGSSGLSGLPRDVLRLVARAVWATCDDDCWAALLADKTSDSPPAKKGKKTNA